MKQILINFLDSIRDYVAESGQNIAHDERESKEFVDIFLSSLNKTPAYTLAKNSKELFVIESIDDESWFQDGKVYDSREEAEADKKDPKEQVITLHDMCCAIYHNAR